MLYFVFELVKTTGVPVYNSKSLTFYFFCGRIVVLCPMYVGLGLSKKFVLSVKSRLANSLRVKS